MLLIITKLPLGLYNKGPPLDVCVCVLGEGRCMMLYDSCRVLVCVNVKQTKSCLVSSVNLEPPHVTGMYKQLFISRTLIFVFEGRFVCVVPSQSAQRNHKAVILQFTPPTKYFPSDFFTGRQQQEIQELKSGNAARCHWSNSKSLTLVHLGSACE